MDKIKILVVDDESRMQETGEGFSGKRRYQVIEAGDGMEAMEQFYDEKSMLLIILGCDDAKNGRLAGMP